MVKQVDLPPFPLLRHDGIFWKGCLSLPDWEAFQRGPGESMPDTFGPVRFVLETVGERLPSAEQVTAFMFLREAEKLILDAVLYSILDEYMGYRDATLQTCPEEQVSALLPAIDRPEQLYAVITLTNVYLLDVALDGRAYVGFGFACVWDEEHGLGVMTNGHRVVAVGQGDTAFLSWIAEEDVRENTR